MLVFGCDITFRHSWLIHGFGLLLRQLSLIFLRLRNGHLSSSSDGDFLRIFNLAVTCTKRTLLLLIIAARRTCRFPRATVVVIIVIFKIESLYMRSVLGFLGFVVLLSCCRVRIVYGCDGFLIKAVALYSAASVGLCASNPY